MGVLARPCHITSSSDYWVPAFAGTTIERFERAAPGSPLPVPADSGGSGSLHRHRRCDHRKSLLRLEPGGLCDPVGLLDLGLEIRRELRGRAADPLDAEIGEPL